MPDDMLASAMTEVVAKALRAFEAALDEATEQGLSRLLFVLEKGVPVRSPLDVLYYDEAWVLVNCKQLNEYEVTRRLLETALARHEYTPADFERFWQSGLVNALDLIPMVNTRLCQRAFSPRPENRWF